MLINEKYDRDVMTVKYAILDCHCWILNWQILGF